MGWEIKIVLTPEGAIVKVVVRRTSAKPRERIIATRSDWSAATPLIDVIAWANREAEAVPGHPPLTSRNLTLFVAFEPKPKPEA